MAKRNVILLITRNIKIYISVIIISSLLVLIISTIIYAQIINDPLRGKSVIIDPGHGGIDGGTSSGENILEKDINLSIGLKLKSILEQNHVLVTMTRTKDVSLDRENNLTTSRHKRDLIARVNKFNNSGCDLFISIHVNRSSSNTVKGPITLFSSKNNKNIILAQVLQKRLNSHIQSYFDNNAIHRPINAEVFILRNASIPGVVVETGFISNPKEIKLLIEDKYQSQLASTLYKGIRDYFSTKESPPVKEQFNTTPYDKEDFPIEITDDVEIVGF